MMAGRQFASANRVPPACITRMGATVPACFTPSQWALYLHECWRQALNRPKDLAKLERGTLPMYCEGCTVAYMRSMQEAGRCKPPNGAITPDMEGGADGQ